MRLMRNLACGLTGVVLPLSSVGIAHVHSENEPLQVDETGTDENEENSLRRTVREDIAQRRAERDAYRDEVRARLKAMRKLRIATNVTAVAADIEVLSGELQVEEGSPLESLNLEIVPKELLDFKNQSLTFSLGYRFLPFIEVFGNAGFLASQTATVFDITGEIPGRNNQSSTPISFEYDFERDVEGYTGGIGTNVGFPIAEIRSRGMALFSSYQINWSSLQDGEIKTTNSRAAVGLIYPADFEAEGNVIYSLSASHNTLVRELTVPLEVVGQPIVVLLEQEFQEPWSMDFGVNIPVADGVSMVFGASQSFSGATSGVVTLNFYPPRKSQ